MISSNENCIFPSTPDDHSSPSTRALRLALSRSNSSAVAMHGPIELAKSLPTPGPMPTLISRELDVARAPVVVDRVADDVRARVVRGDRSAATPDHGADLELVVELLGVGGPRDLVLGPVDGIDVALVERGDVEPLRRRLGLSDVAEMLLDDQVVPEAPGPRDRREQMHGRGVRHPRSVERVHAAAADVLDRFVHGVERARAALEAATGRPSASLPRPRPAPPPSRSRRAARRVRARSRSRRAL